MNGEDGVRWRDPSTLLSCAVGIQGIGRRLMSGPKEGQTQPIRRLRATKCRPFAPCRTLAAKLPGPVLAGRFHTSFGHVASRPGGRPAGRSDRANHVHGILVGWTLHLAPGVPEYQLYDEGSTRISQDHWRPWLHVLDQPRMTVPYRTNPGPCEPDTMTIQLWKRRTRGCPRPSVSSKLLGSGTLR